MAGLDKIHRFMVKDAESATVEIAPGTSFSPGEIACFDNSGKAIKVPIDTITKAATVLGIAEEHGTAGSKISFRLSGSLELPYWSWTTGDIIYASPTTSGALTTDPLGSVVIVGRAISEKKVVITLPSIPGVGNQAFLNYETSEDLNEGDWVALNYTSMTLYKPVANSVDDQMKVLGVVPKSYSAGQVARVITHGRWDSESVIPGPLGIRYLSTLTPGEMTTAVPPVNKMVFLGIKISSRTFIVRIRPGTPVAALEFLNFPQFHGVLMVKNEIYGDLTIPSNYTAIAFDDTKINGNIEFEPNSRLVFLAKRTPSFLEWVTTGLAKGWNEEYVVGAGTEDLPQYKTYRKENEIVREEFFYDDEGKYKKIVFQYSKDNGVTYSTIATKEFEYKANGLLKSTRWS